MAERISVSRTIAAPPEVIWALVTDVTRMGEWSPETTGCEWVGGADGPEVGARFKGTNSQGGKTWSSVCEVIELEPDRRFVFEAMAGPVRYARWGYELEPTDGGTEVTEWTVDQRGRVLTFLGRFVSGVGDRGPHNRAGMETTLERLAAAAVA